MLMIVLSASNGIRPTVSPGWVPTMVPAKVSAVAPRFTRATLLEPSTGSSTTVESSAPPKPVRV